MSASVPSRGSPLLTARPGAPLTGRCRAPADKSVAHRAFILAALAAGESRITGLPKSADALARDIMATVGALRQLGVEISPGESAWHVHGVGVGGLREPRAALDFANSGTAARLICGILTTHPLTATCIGDASLSARPLRITAALESFGARIMARRDGFLPLTIRGTGDAVPVHHQTTAPSAQIKSAVLLAGLNAPGITTVTEPVATRDHTERLLKQFGADVSCEPGDAGPSVRITGQEELHPADIAIPGDPSAAAFAVVAAALIPDSDITIEAVLVNPHRIGLFKTLREMGANIDMSPARQTGGEEVSDIRIRPAPLHGIDVPADRAASMIDEYPVLAVAAAAASGTTRMNGLAELRFKESDRLAAMTAALEDNGVKAAVEGDALVVHGAGGPPPGGGTVTVHGDHRIAMAALVLGLAARKPVAIDDGTVMAASFPEFPEFMAGLGGDIAPATAAGS